MHGFSISDVAWRAIASAIIALMLGGCMQGTLAPATEAGWSARDKQLMSNLPYAQATIPEEYRHRPRLPTEPAHGSVGALRHWLRQSELQSLLRHAKTQQYSRLCSQ